MDAGETSELVGEVSTLRDDRCCGGTEVASELVDCVTSDGCRDLTLTGVDFLEVRTLDELLVFDLDFVFVGTVLGDLARIVLGWLLVVEVMSVPSTSPSLTLDLDAAPPRGSGVSLVPLSTLRLPDSISFCIVSVFRRMLLALAVFRKSAAVVAVSGGLGGARVGAGGDGFSLS